MSNIYRGVPFLLMRPSYNTDGSANSVTPPSIVIAKDNVTYAAPAGGSTLTYTGHGAGWYMTLTGADTNATVIPVSITGSGLAPDDFELITGLQPGVLVSGYVPVNQDTGGSGVLAYNDPNSAPGMGVVTCYLMSDYGTGNRSSSYIKGQSITATDGTWLEPMFLLAGNSYILVYAKPGGASPVFTKAFSI